MAWVPIEKVLEVVVKAKEKTWHWHESRGFRCKYIDIRIDMREGHCMIRDRNGNHITLEELQYQHQENLKDITQNNRPNDPN